MKFFSHFLLLEILFKTTFLNIYNIWDYMQPLLQETQLQADRYHLLVQYIYIRKNVSVFNKNHVALILTSAPSIYVPLYKNSHINVFVTGSRAFREDLSCGRLSLLHRLECRTTASKSLQQISLIC